MTGTRGILLQLNGQFASQEIQLKFRLFTLFTVHVQRIRTTYPATNIKIHNELLVITYITGASEKHTVTIEANNSMYIHRAYKHKVWYQSEQNNPNKRTRRVPNKKMLYVGRRSYQNRQRQNGLFTLHWLLNRETMFRDDWRKWNAKRTQKLVVCLMRKRFNQKKQNDSGTEMLYLCCDGCKVRKYPIDVKANLLLKGSLAKPMG